MKKAFKQLISICLIGILMISVTGCGAEDGATKALEEMMQALKSGDKSRVQSYYDIEALLSKVVSDNKGELETEILRIMNRMQYQILSAEQEEDGRVKISAEIVSLDNAEVMNRFLEKVMAMVASNEYQMQLPNMKRETYQGLLVQQLLDVLAADDIPSVKETVEIMMVKDSGIWKMDRSEETFLDSLFGSFANAIVSLV
ncbi:MAG: hypothetical protein IJB80_03060 [Clostridia bacterium]|nr:hypothetical protein [Clostridia bacterium]